MPSRPRSFWVGILIKLPVKLVERNDDKSMCRRLGAVELVDGINSEFTIFDADGVTLAFRVSRKKIGFLFGLS